MSAPQNPPEWLPPLFPVSPWSETVMEWLYAVFRRDFIDMPTRYDGCEVWFFPERERDKELIFWHLVEREDPPGSGNRLPDFRRCERLPWARAMLDNFSAPEIKAWDYVEGDGDNRTYVWLEALDYVIVMKRYRDGRRRLVTAYCVDYESKRRTLRKKWEKRLK
ncbi:hypothetical protein B1A_03805 [mine drainage metagenome]|uniref:Phage P1-related protein n=2 Tax=mine drainage metagenome TaxID=410659 RepID=T1C4E9_9ZZZZ